MSTQTIEATIEAFAPEGYEIKDYDLDGVTPITWRGPDIIGRNDSWVVRPSWDDAGHTFEINVEGSEMERVLTAVDALDLAYAILAVVNGELESGNEHIAFEWSRI